MPPTAARLRPLALLLPLLLFATELLDAQEPPPTQATVSLGVMRFDLATTGIAPMAAVRAMTAVSSVLVLEGGAVVAPTRQAGNSTIFVAPEAQVQLLLPFTGFVPYMGLGAGAGIDFRGAELGGTSASLSISGSLGFRASLPARFDLQGDARFRGLGVDFEGSTAEFTIGFAFPL
jgi:hypothetical protein